MVLLVVALAVISLVGAGVLIFAAGPDRGRDVPGMSPLADRVRSKLSDDPSPAYGVLSTPEGARRAEERFERAEEAVQDVLVKVTRPVTAGVSASGERLARGVRSGGRAFARVRPRVGGVRPALRRVGPMLEGARGRVGRVGPMLEGARGRVGSRRAASPAPERVPSTESSLPAPAPVGPGSPRRGSQPSARHRH
jgi:hypothetical protein